MVADAVMTRLLTCASSTPTSVDVQRYPLQLSLSWSHLYPLLMPQGHLADVPSTVRRERLTAGSNRLHFPVHAFVVPPSCCRTA